MADWFKAILLGIIEGLTEFLPISSTGHLTLVRPWLGFASDQFTNMFLVVIQLGAILSVLVFFFRQLNPLDSRLETSARQEIWKLWGRTLLAVIPALILGFLFSDLIDEALGNPLVVAGALVVWGFGLIWIESWVRPRRDLTLSLMGWKRSLAIGFFQCLAMIPGTSRSAATILGGMALGAPRETAARFSFFLAIPTMAAASGWALLKYVRGALETGTEVFSGNQMITLAVGFVTSFVVALVVIRAFLQFVSKHSFAVFGWYRIALGLVVILLYVFGGLQGIQGF